MSQLNHTASLGENIVSRKYNTLVPTRKKIEKGRTYLGLNVSTTKYFNRLETSGAQSNQIDVIIEEVLRREYSCPTLIKN